MRSRYSLNSPIFGEMKEEELVPSASLSCWCGASHRVSQMRSQHVAFTERNVVLNKIHEALVDVTGHSDQT